MLPPPQGNGRDYYDPYPTGDSYHHPPGGGSGHYPPPNRNYPLYEDDFHNMRQRYDEDY